MKCSIVIFMKVDVYSDPFNMETIRFKVLFTVFLLISLFPKREAYDLNCTAKAIIEDEEANTKIFSREGFRRIQCFGQEISPEQCTVIDYYDSTKDKGETCEKLELSSVNADGYLSDVGILPYETDYYYNFNVSFTKIKWNYVQMRSRLIDKGDEKHSAWCIGLKMDVDLSASTAISVAHMQWGSWAGGFTSELEMMTQSESLKGYARFLYRVPAIEVLTEPMQITNWVPLVALELSRQPLLAVVWPRLPPHFNVSSFKVQLADEAPEEVRADAICGETFCRMEVDAGRRTREVKVTVWPIHADCSKGADCLWETPSLFLEFSMPWYLWVLLIMVPILAATTIAFTLYYFCCAIPAAPVQVLYLFDATERQHTRAARILAEYLKEAANVECLHEIDQVPKHASKNASKWLQATLEETSSVLFVASPSSHSPIRYTVYPNVFAEALPLLEKCKRCVAHKAKSKRVLVLLPPYLTRDDLPKELRDFRTFHVPSQLDLVVWSLYNPRADCAPVALLARWWLRLVRCPGPMSAYRHQGARLAEALTAAGAAHVLVEQMPPTPDPSDGSIFTFLRSKRSGQGEVESTPSGIIAAQGEYPGDVTKYLLSRVQENETISQSELSIKVAPHEEPPFGAPNLSSLPL